MPRRRLGRGEGRVGLRRAVRTIEEETLEGLFHVELCVEDDEPEADWKCVVASATL